MFSVHLREPTSYMVSSTVPLYPLINKKYYPCGWAVLDNVCGVPVPGASFSEHLREAHVIGIVQVAGLPPHKKYYRCGRAVLDNVCGVLVPGESLSVHLREAQFMGIVQLAGIPPIKSTTGEAGRCLIMFVVSSSPESFSVHLREAHVIGIVQFAGLPPHKKYYQCGWVTLDNVCGVPVPGSHRSVH